ncbi:unnamed protein product [Amoebophrya sp. A25]|nr:unnamed protein product [Amoebophrya sp. A25]|eukprot:GSA25T00020699001.1
MAQQEEIVAEVPAAEAPAVEVEEAPAAAAPEVVEETPATGFQMQPLFAGQLQPLPATFGLQMPTIGLSQPYQFQTQASQFLQEPGTQTASLENTGFVFFPEFDPSILAAAASPGNGSTVELNYTTRDASLTKSKKKGQKSCLCF